MINNFWVYMLEYLEKYHQIDFLLDSTSKEELDEIIRENDNPEHTYTEKEIEAILDRWYKNES